MTPERFFLGILAAAAVAIALGVWLPWGPLARIAKNLDAVPGFARDIRKLAGIVDESAEVSREARDAAKGAAAVSGHVHGVLDKALRNGAPSKPGVTSSGASRAVSGEMAGVVLAREAQPSRPEAEPATARGGVAVGGGGE